MVTNPGTRTWEVTASTFATLNDMYGNRTVCGIGRGDSAMRVAGRKPNTLARISEAMQRHPRARRGPRGRPSTAPRSSCPWVEDGAELPVWMAAYGPKALAHDRRGGRRLHPPARRPLPHRVHGQGGQDAAADGRTRPGRREDLRRRARVRHRRRLARGARPRPRAVPLVRRHGRQPRRRPGRPSTASTPAAVPEELTDVHQGPRGLRLLATTDAPTTPTPRSCPTRSSTGSA